MNWFRPIFFGHSVIVTFHALTHSDLPENSMKIILLPLFDLKYLRNLTRLSDQ
jgi:hypothetical protein